jgi:hypothetical protein
MPPYLDLHCYSVAGATPSFLATSPHPFNGFRDIPADFRRLT